MKEPKRIPINPDLPRTKNVKTYSLKSINKDFVDIDSYLIKYNNPFIQKKSSWYINYKKSSDAYFWVNQFLSLS